KPIRYVWFCMVWPCLVLNYFGQGALLIRNPAAIENPFYLLAPNMMLVPLLLLATMATVIASQAVISGTSSLTRQAIQLGYLPRMRILYTSAKEMGQIYIPFVNWSVLILVLAMVLLFRTSSNLAGAYGVALSVDFLITSLMLLCVMRLKWRWRWLFIAPLMGLFLVVDTTLVMSAATKIPYGGYIPLVIGIILFTLMTTWKRGQRILNTKMSGTSVSVEKFINEIYKDPPLRVSGTAIYMIPWHNTIPSALLNNLKHNKVLHERIIFLTVVSKEVPYVAPEDRVNVYQLGQDFYQLDLHTGFKDEPNVPSALHQCLARGMDFDHLHQASFFFSKETVIPRNGDEMATWREH
ncbi:MAG: KUP/HAK/KT family potassium transporter, partial [Alphaproteobacteria bacterium]|nr:KUP/HAK/KT family potassium transporter [Alphaproteobacteria bacterium]